MNCLAIKPELSRVPKNIKEGFNNCWMAGFTTSQKLARQLSELTI